MSFSGKTILIVGLIVTLLVGIPLTVYLVQQQQENQSHATASTTLSFTPVSTQSKPLVHNVGETIPLDVMIDPGKNIVPVITLDIVYDPAALSVDSTNGFVPNKDIFPTYPKGLPVYTPGHISLTLSTVGTQLGLTGVTAPSRVGTLTVKALAQTTVTQVTFSDKTMAFSSAGPATGSNDSAGENVLLAPLPAFIAIGNGTLTTTGTPTITPTGTSAVTPQTNQSPVCTALNIDRAAAGTAPYALTFTAVGNDPDGTVTKATFNFGDGPTKDVTTGGGIGSQSVNAQIAHTYTNAGTYTASIVLTDNSGGISSSTTCQKTITVAAATQATGGTGTSTGTGTGSAATNGAGTTTGNGGTTVATNQTAAPTPITRLPNTGPGDKFVIGGSAIAVISLIGGILFLAL